MSYFEASGDCEVLHISGMSVSTASPLDQS